MARPMRHRLAAALLTLAYGAVSPALSQELRYGPASAASVGLGAAVLPTFGGLNLTAPLSFNGALFAGSGGGYSNIYDGSGVTAAITFGPTGAPINFYDRTTHMFRANGGGATLAIINASGLGLPLRTPASAAEACVTGTIVPDAGFIYVCTATDTWKRAAIATW